jgi:single-strand DNA-binding protein
MNLNKTMLIGNLIRDPELKTTPNGQTVASFSIATNYQYKNANGEKTDKAEFHNIIAWGKLAEVCGQYLKKGSKAYIEGRLQTRDWTGTDGVKKYRTEIIAENLIMLDGRRAEQAEDKRELMHEDMNIPQDDISVDKIPF